MPKFDKANALYDLQREATELMFQYAGNTAQDREANRQSEESCILRIFNHLEKLAQEAKVELPK